MNTWIKPLMTEMYGGGASPDAAKHATWVLSGFGLSMALGRFLTSTIKSLTVVGIRLIAAVSILTALAVVVMVLADRPAIALVAVLVVGLALAPIFPTIVGVTFSQYEPGLYGSIFGIMFAVGLLGPTAVPKLIGALSVGASVQKSLPVAAVIAVVLCGLALLMGKVARHAPKSASPGAEGQTTRSQQVY